MKNQTKPRRGRTQSPAEMRFGSLTVFSAAHVAGQLGKHPVTIKRCLRKGILKGVLFGGRWYITEASLNMYFNKPLFAEPILEETLKLVSTITDINERLDSVYDYARKHGEEHNKISNLTFDVSVNTRVLLQLLIDKGIITEKEFTERIKLFNGK